MLRLKAGVQAVILGVIAGCHHDPSPADAGDVDAGPTADLASVPDAFAGPWQDFPAAPIIDSSGPGASTPANAGDIFGGVSFVDPIGGPCLIDPEPGALLPLNGLRPRFRVIPVGGQNLFEIRIHAENEVNDLIVYTNNTRWTIPADLWALVNAHLIDQALTISVRGATQSGGVLTSPVAAGTTGEIRIAPVDAAGAIVYWSPITMTAGVLKGFTFGAESVAPVLAPSDVGTTCIGCHASTPDGKYTAFSARGSGASDTQIEMRSVDGMKTMPPYLSAAAATLLQRKEQELPIFSQAHFAAGDRIMLSLSPDLGTAKWDLYWTDLEASSTQKGVGWDLMARAGDSGSVSGASFSHDGQTIVYSSESDPTAGVLPIHGDLYTVPYNNRLGGGAAKVVGASDPMQNEFYPAWSPDDRLIAFTRYPVVNNENSYDNPKNEVFVIPKGGGTATRVVANDPPACSGQTSPGIHNGWPKWSPAAQTVGKKTYYWLAFSSSRSGDDNRQLYICAVVEEGGVLTTYPAVYLWNQPAMESNHTPAWDVFELPIL
jgi:hypothetical protein